MEKLREKHRQKRKRKREKDKQICLENDEMKRQIDVLE